MEDDRLSPLKRFMRACAVAAGVCTCFASLAHTAKDSVAIQNSIDQYNAGTMKFERFWNTYHDSAVYKIFLKQNGENHVRTTLDQAMEYIRATHDYSGGMHQIVYLVGWQYDGHDSKYPSWGSVGGQCKSSFSQDPRESLRAMMREARKYNADVSLHINMNDAYASSPLWKVYVDNDLICRGKNGNIIKGRVFGGEQSYPISHLKEWRSGFAKKRIQELLELLPELKDARTIHIDALFGNESPGDKITFKDDIAAIDECTKYWHEIGFDVTTEFLPAYDQIGYFPYFYHLNLDERHKVLYPPTLICGGTGYSLRSREDYYNKHWQNTMPNAGCIYEEAWGAAHWGDRMGQLVNKSAFINNMFHTMILYAYYNKSRPVEHRVDAENYTVRRANGVVSNIRMKDRSLTVTDNGRTVVSNNDFFLDFPDSGGKVLAFSENGCDRVFKLPPSFADARELKGRRHPDGEDVVLAVKDGSVRLALAPETSLVLRK
ncbi:MAG: hypothetical protein IKE55_06905 [Kiritimatiellae bacterium]|nr:hypothetical protein [Kiritimatiellia bacterium]